MECPVSNQRIHDILVTAGLLTLAQMCVVDWDNLLQMPGFLASSLSASSEGGGHILRRGGNPGQPIVPSLQKGTLVTH